MSFLNRHRFEYVKFIKTRFVPILPENQGTQRKSLNIMKNTYRVGSK